MGILNWWNQFTGSASVATDFSNPVSSGTLLPPDPTPGWDNAWNTQANFQPAAEAFNPHHSIGYDAFNSVSDFGNPW